MGEGAPRRGSGGRHPRPRPGARTVRSPRWTLGTNSSSQVGGPLARQYRTAQNIWNTWLRISGTHSGCRKATWPLSCRSRKAALPPVFPALLFVFRTLLLNMRGDLFHRTEPNPVRRIFQIVAQGFERPGVGDLIPSLAYLMTDENDPAPVLGGLIDDFLHLGKVHIVEGCPHRLRKIADHRVIRGLIKVAPAHQESFSDQRHVTPHVEASPHEFLAAGIGERLGCYPQHSPDLLVRVIELLCHLPQIVVLQWILERKRIVARAGVGNRVVANFMPVCHGLLPSHEALLDVCRLDKKRDPHT